MTGRFAATIERQTSTVCQSIIRKTFSIVIISRSGSQPLLGAMLPKSDAIGPSSVCAKRYSYCWYIRTASAMQHLFDLSTETDATKTPAAYSEPSANMPSNEYFFRELI